LNQESLIAKNLAGLTGALESVILNEELANTCGLLQSLDARVKGFSCILLIVTVGLSHSWLNLAAVLVLVLLFVAAARISLWFFLKRILLFLPFTAIIAIPALFITPGDAWVHIGGVVITTQGSHTAGFLLLRVMDSISCGLLLILTTPWNKLLLALRWFRLPAVLVDIMGMTYRYIFLLLHSTNALFLSRRSRTLGTFSGAENRRWLTRALGSTLAKSQHLSEEVYSAMLSRGYQGEIYSLSRLQFQRRDFIGLVLILLTAAILLWSTYR